MSVALACAWRPRGEVARWERARALLEGQYTQIVVAVPPDADSAQVQGLSAVLGIDVVASPQPFWTRHTALRRILADGVDHPHSGRSTAQRQHSRRPRQVQHIHYADGDRLLHWIETRPEEWRQVVAEIARVDCLILGRSEAAFRSHPQCMQQTEAIINTVGSHLLGTPVDLGAGSRGLSRRAAQLAVDLCPPRP